MEKIYELIGKQVVTASEHVPLGLATKLLLDKGVGRITTLVFQKNPNSPEQWVKTTHVMVVDNDILVVTDTSKIQAGTDSPGHDLTAYHHCRICTLAGVHLGCLADVETLGEDWAISRIDFDNGSGLEIAGTQIVFAKDEILVPNEFESRVLPLTNIQHNTIDNSTHMLTQERGKNMRIHTQESPQSPEIDQEPSQRKIHPPAPTGRSWANYAKLTLGVLLVVLLLVFIIQNAANIQLKFFAWETNLSQALVIVLALLAGVLIGVVSSSWRRGHRSRR